MALRALLLLMVAPLVMLAACTMAASDDPPAQLAGYANVQAARAAAQALAGWVGCHLLPSAPS